MTLDLLVIGALVTSAALGALSGALHQAARFVSAAAAAVLGRPLAVWLAPRIAEATGLPAAIASPAAVAICCFVAYVVLHFVARQIARALTEDREVRAVDRSAGAFFAALQAAAVVWIVLSALVWIDEKTELHLEEGSLAASIAREHNFFVVLRDGSGDGT